MTTKTAAIPDSTATSSRASLQTRIGWALTGLTTLFVLFDGASKVRIIENGKIKATWFVVAGSGTGELAGLRGEGGFEGDFGKGSDAKLDYRFE